MKQYFRWLTALLLSLAVGLPSAVFSQKAPRQIILIVADDLGWKDVGFNGSRYYHTPTLDSLAQRET